MKYIEMMLRSDDSHHIFVFGDNFFHNEVARKLFQLAPADPISAGFAGDGPEGRIRFNGHSMSLKMGSDPSLILKMSELKRVKFYNGSLYAKEESLLKFFEPSAILDRDIEEFPWF